MAEFCEVMKQWRRFCKSHRHCGECEFDGKGICGDVHLSDVTANDIELRIMAWAAEHPVVYPTWGEWFVEHGDLVDGWQNATNSAWMANTALSIFMKPIPADIAEKLGIEPRHS